MSAGLTAGLGGGWGGRAGRASPDPLRIVLLHLGNRRPEMPRLNLAFPGVFSGLLNGPSERADTAWVLSKEGRGESDFSQDLSLSRQRKPEVPVCSGSPLATLAPEVCASVDIRHWQKPCGFLRVLRGPGSRVPRTSRAQLCARASPGTGRMQGTWASVWLRSSRPPWVL